MTVLMGIMVVIMLIGIVSGHRHMMGGQEKEQKKETRIEDADKRTCVDCPVEKVMDAGVPLTENGMEKDKSSDEKSP